MTNTYVPWWNLENLYDSARAQRWHFVDLNLSAKDPDREITGKW